MNKIVPQNCFYTLITCVGDLPVTKRVRNINASLDAQRNQSPLLDCSTLLTAAENWWKKKAALKDDYGSLGFWIIF